MHTGKLITARIIWLFAETGGEPLIAFPPDPPSIIGSAIAIDGDTIEVDGHRLRRWGIDAPELDQSCTAPSGPYRCGEKAKVYLAGLLRGRTIRCQPWTDVGDDGTVVAFCARSMNGTTHPWQLRSLQHDLILEGHAIDYPRYSSGAFAEAQAIAQRSGAGLWVGDFQPPWEWRARRFVREDLAD